MQSFLFSATVNKMAHHTFQKLTETDLVERNYALKQTTWLTIGSLMNALCSNDVDQWAREFKETTERMCPRQLKERYVKVRTAIFCNTQVEFF